VYDENTVKKITNISINGKLDPSAKYFIGTRGGPHVSKPTFASECEQVLDSYLDWIDARDDERDIRKENKKPKLYLEKIPPSEQSANAEAIEEFQNLLSSRINKFGYKVPEPPKIIFDEQTGILPTMYRMCNYQPPLPAPISSTEKYEQLITLIVAVFNVPRMFVDDRHVGGKNVDTEAKIRTEIQNMYKTIMRFVRDIQLVLEDMFKHIYDVSHTKVLLPINPTNDLETIKWLQDNGYITQKRAEHEISKITGYPSVDEESQYLDSANGRRVVSKPASKDTGSADADKAGPDKGPASIRDNVRHAVQRDAKKGKAKVSADDS
jgi:hypothetical protein